MQVQEGNNRIWERIIVGQHIKVNGKAKGQTRGEGCNKDWDKAQTKDKDEQGLDREGFEKSKQ